MKVITTGEGKTDVGRVRSSNQDAFSCDQETGIYIVADGMGGHAGGEIASSLCIRTVGRYLGKNFSSSLDAEEICATMARAVNFASGKIYEHALENPNLKGMGTTATCCLFEDGRCHVAHVGDSRLYLYRSGFLYRMTHDHSLVSEQVRAGVISPEEAVTHRLRNVITRSVGYQEEEDVDTFHFACEKNDLLLLCSDGLHGKLTDREISSILKKRRLHAADQLVSESNERGGEDNITAVLVEVQGLQESDD